MTIEQFGIIFGIVATSSTGVVFAIKEFKRQQVKYRNKLNRSWTNEGDVTLGFKETHFIDLKLVVDLEDGEIWGQYFVNARGVEELQDYSVNGKLFYKIARIEINHFQGRRLIRLGKVKLKLKSNGKQLKWKLTNGESQYFPEKTLMWENPFDSYLKDQNVIQ
jgi:hypothetical protein